jgi:hypothetical protein
MMFVSAANAAVTTVPYISISAGYSKVFYYQVIPSKSLYPANRPNMTIEVTCKVSSVNPINGSACMLNYSTTYQTMASDGTPANEIIYTNATINETMSEPNLNAYVSDAATPWDFFFICNNTGSPSFNSSTSSFEVNINNTKLGVGNVTWDKNGILSNATFYQEINMTIYNQNVTGYAKILIGPYVPPAATPGMPVPVTLAFTLAGVSTVIIFALKKGKWAVNCK